MLHTEEDFTGEDLEKFKLCEKMAAKGKPLAEPSGCITGDCAGCGMSAACTGKKPAAEAPAEKAE